MGSIFKGDNPAWVILINKMDIDLHLEVCLPTSFNIGKMIETT